MDKHTFIYSKFMFYLNSELFFSPRAGGVRRLPDAMHPGKTEKRRRRKLVFSLAVLLFSLRPRRTGLALCVHKVSRVKEGRPMAAPTVSVSSRVARKGICAVSQPLRGMVSRGCVLWCRVQGLHKPLSWFSMRAEKYLPLKTTISQGWVQGTRALAPVVLHVLCGNAFRLQRGCIAAGLQKVASSGAFLRKK